MSQQRGVIGPGSRVPNRRAAGAVPGAQAGQAKYPLPKATVTVLQRHSKQGQPYVGSNLSLALNKLAGPWAILDSTQARLDAGTGSGRQQNRRIFLRALLQEPGEAREIRQFMLRRQRALLDSYHTSGWSVCEHRASPEWRFVSGLGMANPLETNLVLHRIGGFPYIPGSSIKGAVRAYAELTMDGGPAKPDAPAAAIHPAILQVFGAQSQQGKVIFFDALPVTTPKLELDVINVHYPDYYGSGQPPTDWQDPNPVLFLAVGKATAFSFAVASRQRDLADQAMAWLKGALQNTGLGGKASAGYGFFVERR